MEKCEDCGGPTENDGIVCEGAIAQQYTLDPSFTGLNLNQMITCNCCEACRLKCRESAIKEEEE